MEDLKEMAMVKKTDVAAVSAPAKCLVQKSWNEFLFCAFWYIVIQS